MKRLTTLTGKNLPKLSVAKPGWPTPPDFLNANAFVKGPPWLSNNALSDFTRVCDQTGLSERLRKD